jgi:hypothetical protein
LAAYGGANPDTTNTLAVNLAESQGQLISGTSSDAQNAVTLCYCGGELLSYQTAALTSGYAYNLTTLYRGLYGTSAASHASGAQFARLDQSTFKYQLPSGYIGVTLYFKFQSFNIFGLQPQDLSTCTAYTFSPLGTGFGGGTGGVPTTPTGLTATGGVGQNVTAWSANPTSDNLTAYELFRANGTGASFGSATLLVTLGAGTLSYTDTGLPPLTGYTYFLKAVNAVGASANTAGVNAATTAATSGGGNVGTATTTATVNNNSACYLTTAGIKMANATVSDPTSGSYAPCNVFVKTGGASSTTVTYYYPGQFVGSGYTARATYWLDTTSGNLVTTPPSTSGNGTQQVGLTDSSGNLFFNPMPMTGI